MVSSEEKRQLLESYREPVNARAVVAKCAAGLLVIIGIAVVGITTDTGDSAMSAAAVTPRVALGR